jgi:hypothetical protein
LRLAHAAGVPVVEAAAYLGSAGYRTYAGPQRFAGRDGITYRVKYRAQEGHGAEFIANRIGSSLGIAPSTSVISVSPAALPRDRQLSHLEGLQLGSAELEQVFNHDELIAYGVQLEPSMVEWDSWALVVCFQTWLYVRDPQAVIRMTDGKCFSVDHGNCFGELPKGPPSAIVVPALNGVSGVQFDSGAVDRAVSAIEAIPEQAIIAMVAGVPDAIGWRMSIAREFGIAQFLLNRQSRLREVMVPWMPRLS